jgi:superfamily II DNA or RNA helicase
VLTHDDQYVLQQFVPAATYERGLVYARIGAVKRQVWSPDGRRVIGEVKGSQRSNYLVNVIVGRSLTQQMTSFRSTCTCPMAVNCKHGVALLLAERAEKAFDVKSSPVARGNGHSTSPSATSATSWMHQLDSALTNNAIEATTDHDNIALQFDLDDQIRYRSLKVRPLIKGASGKWIKTGISWTSLDYFGYRRGPIEPSRAQVLVLKEILSLSRLTQGSDRYAYVEDDIFMERISSRRVWNLLSEAQELGVQLIDSTPAHRSVVLLNETLRASIDVIRRDGAVSVGGRLFSDEVSITVEQPILLGDPVHGAAWWEPSNDPVASPSLQLAPLQRILSLRRRNQLLQSRVFVPANDEERFLSSYLPRLRRTFSVSSSDGSVELPPVAPTSLLLSIEHGPGVRCTLAWRRSLDEGAWQEPLWNAQSESDRDGDLAALVKAASIVAAPLSELFETFSTGSRLAAHCSVTEMSAVILMNEIVPELEKIVGIDIEQTGEIIDFREAVAGPRVSLREGPKTDGDWFDLTVDVSVGDEPVVFRELFLALARNQSHLILPSGTYFSLDDEQLQELAATINEARTMYDSPRGELRLSRFQASLFEDFERLGVITAQANEWTKSVSSLANIAERVDYPAPPSLRATLRAYQLVGFNWLAFLYDNALGGVLADDMGLGKTVQALALMCHVNERSTTRAPFLVVAPTSVVGNWASECRRFAPHLKVVTVSETQKRRGESIENLANDADVVITSYTLLRLEFDGYDAVKWAGVFLDEAQFTKNRSSLSYQRAKSLSVPFKIAMTGTPIENSLMDLWSLLSVTAPGLFPSAERFDQFYRRPIERDANRERLDQLRRRVLPLMLRRTKEQVASDLPVKLEQILELDLNAKHRKVYQTYLQRERQKVLGLLDDVQRHRFEILRSLTLLRIASLDVSIVDEKNSAVPSTKLDHLMEMLDDIVADGHRVIVFSQFTKFLGLARERIRAAGIDHCYLDGRTRKRPEVIDRFREGDAPVFLISLKAGGFGLNLTEADYCIILDPWWNPATEAQAVDRVHRIGQTKKVMVYRLVAKETIEEKVMALKGKKAALVASVLDGGGFESGAMTAHDIRSLLD